VSYDLNYRASLWNSHPDPDAARHANCAIAAECDLLIGDEYSFAACLGMDLADLGGRETPMDVGPADAAALRGLVERYEWIWICGNHDPVLPALLGGRIVLGELRLAGLVMRHQAEPDALGEVSGHYHPKSHIDVRGQRLSGACFIHDERRILLPAFGAYTGGLHIESEAIRALFPTAFRIDLLLRGQLMRREYPIAAL